MAKNVSLSSNNKYQQISFDSVYNIALFVGILFEINK